ncbi:MAG: PKD domain-containing protein, partial [Thaumarchaeota archaeon]|nr:PKD domain-containing protein [Nitrososphaerota archaeon]
MFAISSIGLIFEDSFAQTGFSLTPSDSLTDTKALELDGAYGITSFTINSKTYVAVTAERDNGIQIIDVSDPTDISATDSLTDNDMFDLDSPFGITSFTINSKTYVAVTGLVDNIVQIIDVSDPTDISATDSLTDTETLQLAGAAGITSFTINSKTYVAVAAQNDNGIQIIDVSDPTDISATDSLTTDTKHNFRGAFGITSFTINSKTYVGVASYTGGIQIIDVSDPTDISATGSLPITAGAYGITSFMVNSKTYVGVATRLGGGVQIIDVSDPTNISATDSLMDDRTLKLATASGITSFTIGSKTYVGVAARLDDGVQIIDVSDPDNISAIYSLTDTTSLELDGASGITSFMIDSKTYVGVTGIIDDGVQILGVDRALIADAGPDQNVALRATVTLDGTGSTYPDGETITYSWTQTSGPDVTLTDATTANPTFTAPTTIGPMVFTLTVTAGGLKDTDMVTINVSDAPVADAGDDQTVAPGATVTLDGSGSMDSDGDPLSYAWTVPAGSGVMLVNANTASPTFTAPTTAGPILFTLAVSAGGLTGTDTVTITISNQSPTANAGDDQTVAPGATVTLSGSGTDPNGDSLSYSWERTSGTSVMLSSTSSQSPTFTAPTSHGTILFTLTVSDGTNSATDTVTITVSNQSPSAEAGPNQVVAPGATVTLSGSGTDPNGDSLSYSWERTSGTSVMLSSTSSQSP